MREREILIGGKECKNPHLYTEVWGQGNKECKEHEVSYQEQKNFLESDKLVDIYSGQQSRGTKQQPVGNKEYCIVIQKPLRLIA